MRQDTESNNRRDTTFNIMNVQRDVCLFTLGKGRKKKKKDPVERCNCFLLSSSLPKLEKKEEEERQ